MAAARVRCAPQRDDADLEWRIERSIAGADPTANAASRTAALLKPTEAPVPRPANSDGVRLLRTALRGGVEQEGGGNRPSGRGEHRIGGVERSLEPGDALHGHEEHIVDARRQRRYARVLLGGAPIDDDESEEDAGLV